MDYIIDSIELDNFKSYSTPQTIKVSDLTILLGANSSGKSTALQALLLIKQTMECNSPDIDLLLSGKYVALGDFDDIISDKNRKAFSIRLNFVNTGKNENSDEKSQYSIKWTFTAGTTSNVCLSNVVINFDDNNLILDNVSPRRFQLLINNEKTPIHFDIKNLQFPVDYILKYDSSFNRELINFLNSITVIANGNKSKRLKSNELASNQVTAFFLEIMENKGIQPVQNDIETGRLAGDIATLIRNFCYRQNPLKESYFYLTTELEEACLVKVITQSNNVEEFMKLYEQYKTTYDNWDMNKPIDEYDQEEKMPLYFIAGEDSHNDSKEREICSWTRSFYNNVERLMNMTFFLGPIRELPRGLYNIGFENVPKYVGPTGSNFASVLHHENKQKGYILPDGEIVTMSLMDAVDEWAIHLNIASEIRIEHTNSFGINVSINNTQNIESDIMNVGIGTSQVLPVLIMGLLSEKNETLIFEQPELHLHPYSQSRLADFFVELAKNGRKVFVETHSETILLRLRYHLLIGSIEKNALAVNFFQNKGGTKVAECKISGHGIIDYPADFKDETQELLNDLLDAAIQKRKR